MDKREKAENLTSKGCSMTLERYYDNKFNLLRATSDIEYVSVYCMPNDDSVCDDSVFLLPSFLGPLVESGAIVARSVSFRKCDRPIRRGKGQMVQ